MSLVQAACVQLSLFSFVALGKGTKTKKIGQHPAHRLNSQQSSLKCYYDVWGGR